MANKEIFWTSESLKSAMDLEKYFTTLALAGIAIVTSLREITIGLAVVGLGFLLSSAIISSISMIILWETTTMQYISMPINRGFSRTAFICKLFLLLSGFVLLVVDYAQST